MKKISEIILELKSGNASEEKLEEYLAVDNIAVQWLCINEIRKFKFMNDKIINRLLHLSNDRESEQFLRGYSISDFAIVLLLENEVSENEIPLYEKLDDFEKDTISRLMNSSEW